MQIVQDFIPKGRRNRPGYKLEPRYITVHDTANTSAGADAKAHANYVKSAAAAAIPASWHFTVDDKVIYQHLPLNENGWHAGDGTNGTGNRQSIGIEICENSNGNRAQAEKNAAWLTAKLLKDHGLKITAVKQHYDWSKKNCPAQIRGRKDGWKNFLAAVEAHLTPTGTPIMGPAQATFVQAQEWARLKGAHLRFIAIAPAYWSYGALTGIRPEVLYAQSAKETAYGRYGGAVTPDMNNWAGIKTKNATGDRREDHESFATPADGVRAHFNHMCAYVGLKPVGTPHGRYYVVQDLSWAGTVKDVEELGGKWAPSASYGIDIVKMLAGLLATPAPAEPEPPVEPEPEPLPEPEPPVEPEPPEEPEPVEPEPPPEPPKEPAPDPLLLAILRWLVELIRRWIK
jgi:N-acetyl-anhydromuramyl-L-alanine amidase AmpD